MTLLFPSMHQDNRGYLCMIIQPALKEDAGWYTVSAKNEAGIVSSTARLDVHSESGHTYLSLYPCGDLSRKTVTQPLSPSPEPPQLANPHQL